MDVKQSHKHSSLLRWWQCIRWQCIRWKLTSVTHAWECITFFEKNGQNEVLGYKSWVASYNRKRSTCCGSYVRVAYSYTNEFITRVMGCDSYIWDPRWPRWLFIHALSSFENRARIYNHIEAFNETWPRIYVYLHKKLYFIHKFLRFQIIFSILFVFPGCVYCSTFSKKCIATCFVSPYIKRVIM